MPAPAAPTMTAKVGAFVVFVALILTVAAGLASALHVILF